MTITTSTDSKERADASSLEVLRVFLKLGLMSFGGPVAHLSYFRNAFVVQRRWLDEPASRRPDWALPVPAGSGEQPGRVLDRPHAGGRRRLMSASDEAIFSLD
jgi:hypothetical protein